VVRRERSGPRHLSRFEERPGEQVLRIGANVPTIGAKATRITEEIRPVTAVAKVIPERDFELGAGFGEAKEGITAVTTISLRVPALTFRLVTWQRMSFSDPLVCRISGRSSTINKEPDDQRSRHRARTKTALRRC
jgi:hypothetical protein